MKSLRISDLHFKHNRLPSLHLSMSLKTCFKENHELFKDLDVIFVVGDLTDTSISVHDPDYLVLVDWINFLLIYCYENDIALRVLEGTASHDLKQGRMIYGFPLSNKINFKYIDKPYIETLVGKTVLYVPDDWASSRDELDRDIAEVLKEEGLQKVDMAMLHGLFDYQLPMLQNHVAFNEEYMLSIVDGYISIGHDHTHKPKGRIIPQGSFDRMSFNEEGDKGGIYVDTDKDGYKRIINKNALIFKDIDVEGLFQACDIEDFILPHPKGSWFRIVGKKDNTLVSSVADVRVYFPGYNIETKVLKSKEEKIPNVVMDIVPKIVLNENTLVESLRTHMTGKEYSSKDIDDSCKLVELAMSDDL